MKRVGREPRLGCGLSCFLKKEINQFYRKVKQVGSGGVGSDAEPQPQSPTSSGPRTVDHVSVVVDEQQDVDVQVGQNCDGPG